MPYAGVTIVRKDFFIAVGQYVKRNGKTYYKGDDGKLYTSYENAVSRANLNPFGRFVRNVSQGLDKLGANPLSIPQKGFNELTYMANQIAAGQTPYANLGRGALAEEIPQNQPVNISAGTVQPGAITRGVTSSGEIDRSQSDEYKSQMAQYQNLINQKKTQEAEDLGMQIWMQKYGKSPMAQAGGAVGAYNPLLASMFPETKGFATTSAPEQEEIQMGDLGTRAQGEMGPTMETLNPMAAQAQQQAATAAQADKATTAGVKIPVRNRVQAFLYGGM